MNNINLKEFTIYLSIFLISIFVLFILNSSIIGLPITGDDIWAPTAAQGNPLEVIIFTLRWDLHPPLYYSFLDLWASINNSDIWLRSNSLFLHALLVLSVFIYISKNKDYTTAIISSALVFTSPFLLSYSYHLRMYSFISLLSFWQFALTNEYIKGKKKYIYLIIVNSVVISNSHAVGILFVFFHFLYGVINIFKNKKILIHWILYHFLIFIFSLPAIINSIIKSVGHAIKPDINNVLNLIHNLFIFDNYYLIILPISFILLSFLFIEQRKIIFCYLIAPIVFFSFVSYIIKPMWLQRDFIFSIPIICIAMADTLSRLPINKVLKFLIPGIIIFSNIIGFYQRSKPVDPEAFSPVLSKLSKEINESKGKICIISENTLNTFWSLQRYINGTDWGNPLDIQPPLTDRWANISHRLPEVFVNILALNPTPNFTENEKVILSSGFNDRCRANDIDKTLLITDYGSKMHSLNFVYKNSRYAIYNYDYQNVTANLN